MSSLSKVSKLRNLKLLKMAWTYLRCSGLGQGLLSYLKNYSLFFNLGSSVVSIVHPVYSLRDGFVIDVYRFNKY
jgi:hypothetical protein